MCVRERERETESERQGDGDRGRGRERSEREREVAKKVNKRKNNDAKSTRHHGMGGVSHSPRAHNIMPKRKPGTQSKESRGLFEDKAFGAWGGRTRLGHSSNSRASV